LQITQHRKRTIRRLNEILDLTLRDKSCRNSNQPTCQGRHLHFRPVEEGFLALPGDHIGLDIILQIGALRMREDLSFPRIHARLGEQKVQISGMAVQYQFRKYLSLVGCQAGRADSRLIQQLRQQGVLLPIIDGIQFGTGEPTLYLIIDAFSRRALFGQELLCRGADDLVPFIRQIHELGIPILGVVSDKEKGLVPAIEKALPGVPHQYCQLHYIDNVAKPMEDDLQALGAEVRQTEENLRKLERTLIHQRQKAEQEHARAPSDLSIALELCQAARDEARRHARAPFDPPALKRHEGLQRVSDAVAEARQKKGGLGTTSKPWSEPSTPLQNAG
jgi:hypothetical protein